MRHRINCNNRVRYMEIWLYTILFTLFSLSTIIMCALVIYCTKSSNRMTWYLNYKAYKVSFQGQGLTSLQTITLTEVSQSFKLCSHKAFSISNSSDSFTVSTPLRSVTLTQNVCSESTFNNWTEHWIQWRSYPGLGAAELLKFPLDGFHSELLPHPLWPQT